MAIDRLERIWIRNGQMPWRDADVLAVLLVSGIESFEPLASASMVDELRDQALDYMKNIILMASSYPEVCVGS